MEVEVPENPRSEGFVGLARDPLEKKDCHHQPSTSAPLDKQDDFLPSASPALDKKDDHPLSIDPPVPEKQYDRPPSSSCNSGFEQDKTCASPCVSRSAEMLEKALVLSIARNIKQEPMEKKLKEEPIYLEDDFAIHSSRNDVDDDDDDCIIVLDVVPADKKRKNKPKAISAEIVLISDDEDSVKGDKEPSVSTSSQNLKPKEKVATEPTVNSSVSEDTQVDQVKTVTNINVSHSLLKKSGEGGNPISKAVCEVFKELTDRPSTPSSVVGINDKSNAIIEDVSETVSPSSPASFDKVSEDVTTCQLAWTEDNLKDTPPVPEPVLEDESTYLANVISEQDDEAQGLEDVNIPFGDGYDSDGWEVDSDDESNKDATKTDKNSDKGRETEQIMERSDVTRRKENIDAKLRSAQIIPVDSDLTTGQDNSLVPIGIIPIASVVNTRLKDVRVSPLATGTGESGKHTVVSPMKKAALMEPTPSASDLKSMTQDDGDSPGLRSQSKQTTETSIDEDMRAAITRSKLRSRSTLLKEVNEDKSPPGKCVKENLPDVVKANLQPDNPVFNCHLCFHSFTKKKLLEEHLLNHPKVTRIMCRYCNTSFQRQRNLNTHLKRCYNRKKRKSPRKILHEDPQNSKRIKNGKGDRAGRSEQLSSLSKERRKLDFPAKKECPRIKTEGAHHNRPIRKVKHECKKEQKNQNLKGNRDQKDAELEISMKLKDDITVWLCPKCHGSFTSRSKVKRHMYLTHSGTNAKDSLELKTMRKEEASKLIYYCSTCKESYRSQYYFDRHKSTKKGKKRCEKLFQCNLCFKHFDKKVDCASHVQEHLKPVESMKRKRSSSSPTDRQSNQKRAKICDEFKCRYCSKKFELKYLCVKHELTHTDRDPWHCYICFKIFYLESSIIAHMEKAHKEASYCKKCFCIMTSKDKKLCIDCDKRREGSGLKCSICKTEFVKPSDLTLHILTHVESEVETSVANAPKASKVSLDPEFQNVPQISVARHPPSVSMKISEKRTNPMNNNRPVTRLLKEVLSKEKPTTNTIPHKSSVVHKLKTSPLDNLKTSKAQSRPKQDYRRVTRSLSERLPTEALTTKTKEHTHSKYDVCMKCGERDILPKELSKHARTHLDVRSRYQCNTCQQCFVNMYEIEEHGCVPNHQASCSYTVSNMVYQCQFCGRAFQNMMEARKHVLSTNASCLLECTECKAEFSRQGDLMVHMVSIHGQYLECDKCSAQFTRQFDLDYHKRQHEDMNH